MAPALGDWQRLDVASLSTGLRWGLGSPYIPHACHHECGGVL